MCSKIVARIQVVAFLLGLILPRCAATAQNAQTAALGDQLRAQYKVAKFTQQDNSARVVQLGTVLVIQKGGILAVPYASTAVCSAKYQGGKVESPDALCPETARKNSRPFKVGEKVYPTQIDVDLKGEKISFHILTCDSCTGTTPTTPSKSEVIFQFPPGSLEKASVLEVEDTIGDVLAIDNSTASQALQAASSQPEEADPNLLTNDKIAKMANAKLGDAVIVSMIKTSACSFDTSSNAVIKLKQAGVSDAVLQAMIEAAAAPQAGTAFASTDASLTPEAPTSTPTEATFHVRHRHISLTGPGSDAIYYCSGELSVSADGTVRYDCTQTDDPSGRCEHVAFSSGSLKQAKIGYGGILHLASKGQGNADFYGDPSTLQQALAAIAPLAGSMPTAARSISAKAQPDNAPRANCENYESCMKSAAASLDASQSMQALANFQQASQIDPSKGDPWKGIGDAYLQMGQYDDAARMWDKALELGATLSSYVCHAGMACGDTGDFLLSMKEVSFISKKKGQKEFAAAPLAVTSEVGFPRVWGGNGQIVAYYVQLRSAGKNYRFYYGPKSVQCRDNFLCPEPGLTQQKVFADYVHNTLDKLREGSFVSESSKP